jgi:hypothetical protein
MRVVAPRNEGSADVAPRDESGADVNEDITV